MNPKGRESPLPGLSGSSRTVPAPVLLVLATILAAVLVTTHEASGEDARGRGPDLGAEPQILQSYVDGEITDALTDGLMADVRQWISEHPEIRTIILRVDSPGGAIEPVEKLAHFIYEELKGFTTIAFIAPGANAYSGGAIVAIAAKEIVMGNDSHIGAVAPVAIAGLDVKELGEKWQSAIRNRLKTYAADRGYPTLLTDSMVSKAPEDILMARFSDQEKPQFLLQSQYDNLLPEERLRKIGEPVTVLRRGQLLVMNEKEAKDYGFVKHIANNLTELRNALLLPVGDESVIDSRMGRLKSRFPAGQAVVDFFNKPFPRFVLILVGCLGILIELKTFGLLVPALISLAAFTVFFATSLLPVSGSIEGTASLPEVLLFVLGAGLVAVEFMLLPGMAIFAITGAALCAVSIVLAMVPGSASGVPEPLSVEQAIEIFAFGFGAGAVCFLVLLRFLPHNPIFARRGLVSHASIVGVPTADSALAAQDAASSLVGKRGTALSNLRPAGKVETDDGQLLDVVAEGDFVERGTRVKVRECQDGQIIVVRVEGS